MRVLLQISGCSFFDCEVVVNDFGGTKNYFMNLTEAEQESPRYLEIDVYDGNFELTVIPKMADYRATFENMCNPDWKSKLANKLGSALLSIVENMILCVGCKYKVSDLCDNDIITLSGWEYVFGIFDKLDFFDLIPVSYVFFEASSAGKRYELSDIFSTNRKDVIIGARKIALIDFGLSLIFTYPIQVGRIKRLTSDKKVKKELIKFSKMDDQKRQKILDKNKEFMS